MGGPITRLCWVRGSGPHVYWRSGTCNPHITLVHHISFMQREEVGYMVRWMVKSTPLQACHQVICEAHSIQARICSTHEVWVVSGGNQQA